MSKLSIVIALRHGATHAHIVNALSDEVERGGAVATSDLEESPSPRADALFLLVLLAGSGARSGIGSLTFSDGAGPSAAGTPVLSAAGGASHVGVVAKTDDSVSHGGTTARGGTSIGGALVRAAAGAGVTTIAGRGGESGAGMSPALDDPSTLNDERPGWVQCRGDYDSAGKQASLSCRAPQVCCEKSGTCISNASECSGPSILTATGAKTVRQGKAVAAASAKARVPPGQFGASHAGVPAVTLTVTSFRTRLTPALSTNTRTGRGHCLKTVALIQTQTGSSTARTCVQRRWRTACPRTPTTAVRETLCEPSLARGGAHRFADGSLRQATAAPAACGPIVGLLAFMLLACGGCPA